MRDFTKSDSVLVAVPLDILSTVKQIAFAIEE
jgi:NAD(P)-dependent dehydrogenase (short-subunit alcohol dehydrogenase family)